MTEEKDTSPLPKEERVLVAIVNTKRITLGSLLEFPKADSRQRLEERTGLPKGKVTGPGERSKREGEETRSARQQMRPEGRSQAGGGAGGRPPVREKRPAK